MYEDASKWQAAVEKGVRSVFPGISRVVVSTGGGCCPMDEGLASLILGMKGIKADELLLDLDGEKLLVVKYDYGELAAAVYYGGDASPADLSRLIQLIFARRELRASSSVTVPAATVEKLAGRWKYRIAFVFGDAFASRLVEGAFRDKDKGAMTAGELEGARAYVSSALGDCLLLDKVNK